MEFFTSRTVLVRCSVYPGSKFPFFVTIFKKPDPQCSRKKPDGSLFAACNICEHGQNGSMCAECWLYVRHEMERDPYQNEL